MLITGREQRAQSRQHGMNVTNELSMDSEVVAPASATPRLIISVELVVYVVLIMFSLVWRLPELGTIPPGDVEAHEALAAFHAVGTASVDSMLVAHKPLMFAANTLAMTLFGTDTATARLPTVLVAVLLIGMPILFRRWLGNVTALLTSALLAISCVLFMASRTMSGPVWSMAVALLAVYFVGRFIETRVPGYALAATTLLIMLVLMAEPAGFITFLGLLAGVMFALASTEDPDNRYRNVAGAAVRGWPWLRALITAGIVIGLVSTVFLLYPRGFATIGELANQAIRGIVTRPADYPFLFPLRASLLYEPLLWLFGLIGAYQVLTSDEGGLVPFLKRAAVGWLFISFVASIFYAGAESSHALWFTLPLAVLAAATIERMLMPVRDRFWNVPSWGPWLHGVATLAMLLIAGVNLVIIGRAWMMVIALDRPAADAGVTARILFEAPAIMLIVITFFLIASMWGTRAAWRGLGIGTLALLTIFSLGTAWRAGVVHSADPPAVLEGWACSREFDLVQTTLVTPSRAF